MEVQINDLVKVQYEENVLIGQVYKHHPAMEQYDVMLPELGLKRFPYNCVLEIVGHVGNQADGGQ